MRVEWTWHIAPRICTNLVNIPAVCRAVVAGDVELNEANAHTATSAQGHGWRDSRQLRTTPVR